MNDASPQGWISYAIPAVIILIVMAFRLRNVGRARPLKIERLWVVPTLYCLVAGLAFARQLPHGIVWLYCLLGLVAGAALGWQRGRLMRIEVDPATHEISQTTSPAAILFILVLILIRSAVRNSEALGIPAMHVDIGSATDVAIASALGLLSAMRVEMFLRARRLLDAARGTGRAA